MNLVKAGMVEKIEDYKWSSYRHNALALGMPDKLKGFGQAYELVDAIEPVLPENQWGQTRLIFC